VVETITTFDGIVSRGSSQFTRRHGVSVEVSIGLNHGPVVVGLFGKLKVGLDIIGG